MRSCRVVRDLGVSKRARELLEVHQEQLDTKVVQSMYISYWDRLISYICCHKKSKKGEPILKGLTFSGWDIKDRNGFEQTVYFYGGTIFRESSSGRKPDYFIYGSHIIENSKIDIEIGRLGNLTEDEFYRFLYFHLNKK